MSASRPARTSLTVRPLVEWDEPAPSTATLPAFSLPSTSHPALSSSSSLVSAAVRAYRQRARDEWRAHTFYHAMQTANGSGPDDSGVVRSLLSACCCGALLSRPRLRVPRGLAATRWCGRACRWASQSVWLNAVGGLALLIVLIYTLSLAHAAWWSSASASSPSASSRLAAAMHADAAEEVDDPG